MDSAQDSNLAPFIGDFNQCENLSEIKEPLVKPGCYKRSQKNWYKWSQNMTFLTVPTVSYHINVNDKQSDWSNSCKVC